MITTGYFNENNNLIWSHNCTGYMTTLQLITKNYIIWKLKRRLRKRQ